MRRWLPAAPLALLVAACSGDIKTRISSSGIASPSPQSYMIASAEKDSEDLARAHVLVGEALAARGFALAKEAPLHLEVTVDTRDASLSLGSAAGTLSPAKRRKPLQSCADKEYRLGITLTRIADGVEIYRGRAAEYHCNMQLNAALPTLATAALADFGQPRGSYRISRRAID